MLHHPSIEKLTQLRLHTMAKALQEQDSITEIDDLCFEERLGLLLDRELNERDTRKLQLRLRHATLRLPACFEDINWRQPRGLDKPLMLRLGSCQWLNKHLNCLISGPTGVGKSWLACALAHKACLEGYHVKYYRCSRLLEALKLGRGDGSYAKLMKQMGKADLLIIDDFGIGAINDTYRHDLLEVLEERYNRRSTLVTSQLPVDKWYEYLDDPTLADAILDRLVHNAYRIALDGDSMRKQAAPETVIDEKEVLR